MEKNNIIWLSVLALLAVVLIWWMMRKENLSLSQFPVPTCSTCKSCKFYSCGQCGTVYQEQNKIGQACDCGGFTVYKTPLERSCLTQTLNGGPMETFETKGSCQSCKANEYTCLQASGTFDSGTTFLRNLPCPVPFPPVSPQIELVAQKQLRHLSELDVYDHLERGGLLVGAKSGKVAEYAIQKLIEATENKGSEGYPNFYYIDGPVLIMTKVAGHYFWMTDYPIKYNPKNFGEYVNSSPDWKIAKTAYQYGRKLLDQGSPIFLFEVNPLVKPDLEATAFACLPEGAPQSSTDYYYPRCSKGSCLWGPPYGSGNWLLQV